MAANRTQVQVPVQDTIDSLELPNYGTPEAPCWRGTLSNNFAHDYSVIRVSGSDLTWGDARMFCSHCGTTFPVKQ